MLVFLLMITIGVMGATGSFSEQAGYLYIDTQKLTDVKLDMLVTADRLLQALDSGLINRAIFPVMNNNGGVVIEALHAMGRYQFVVESIFDMKIEHMLMVSGDIDKISIRKIVSHDQAIKQCSQYLSKNYPLVQVDTYEDTAKAAADLASGILSKETAVIASAQAAQLYGLKIIDTAVQDNKNNITTFVVVVR